MKTLLLLLALLLPAGLTAYAQSAPKVTFTGLRRTFSDNSEWQLGTSAGTGRLRRVFSDGSQWTFTIPGHTYTIRRTFSDDAEWSITEAGQSVRFHTTFSHDLNDWGFGQQHFRTVFSNDFKQWKAAGFQVRAQFNDYSSWALDDQGQASEAERCGMLFVAVLASTGSH